MRREIRSGLVPAVGNEHVVSYSGDGSQINIVGHLPFAQWADTLGGDATLTAALLDRLLHYSHTVQVSGQSYRMMDKRKIDQIKVPVQSD